MVFANVIVQLLMTEGHKATIKNIHDIFTVENYQHKLTIVIEAQHTDINNFCAWNYLQKREFW